VCRNKVRLVCCSEVQGVCCSVLHSAVEFTRNLCLLWCHMLQCVAVCRSVLPCVAVCCSVLS